MVGVVLLSRKMKVNPDNVATPIAASLGDLITLTLLAGVSSLLYSAIGEWLLSFSRKRRHHFLHSQNMLTLTAHAVICLLVNYFIFLKSRKSEQTSISVNRLLLIMFAVCR